MENEQKNEKKLTNKKNDKKTSETIKINPKRSSVIENDRW